jgi:hypothetical protein
MELLAVRKAACLYSIRLELLNPKGKALDVDVTTRMVERYRFLKYPVTYADFHPSDGVAFGMGVFGDVQVVEVRIFPDGLFIWTGESTDRAEAMFPDLIELMVSAGAEYRPEFITNLAHISEMVVRSEIDLGHRLTSPIDSLVAKAFPGKVTGFAMMAIATGEKLDLDGLRIERLAENSQSRNEYWSRATLSSANHFQLLQDLERLLV